MQELPKKLCLLLKPRLVPVVFLLVFLLVAGFFAVTQETGGADNSHQGDPQDDFFSPEYEEAAASVEAEASREAGIGSEFIFANYPPRWFRSNAGGMAIEEAPSRLGAFRNKYALLIDYVPLEEIDPRLLPFYKDEYFIEIRILYEERKESRRQWLFRDKDGNTMVNAVFRLIDDGEIFGESALVDTEADDKSSDDKSSYAEASGGFIEVFNENGRISRDYSFFEDGSEILTAYFYNENVLIRAETQTRDAGRLEYRKTHTDNYRYNRSYSLRSVERVFLEGIEPVRLVFPGRVLDAAYDKDFLKEKLTFSSEFLGGYPADAGFRIVYDTDSRGRVVSETLYDNRNEFVWKLENTWAGDRIIAILKTEGADERLIEFDYDASGNRIAERDIRNGVLERKVLIDGNKETEELYLDGAVALRAFWEDGRKISEERVRRR